MTYLSPKEVAIRWFEQVWHTTSKEVIHEFLAEDAIAHLEGGVDVHGPVEFSAYHDQLIKALPDLRVQILRVVGDETQACLHWQATGTHKGELMGYAATQKVLTFTGMTFMIVRDGKMIEGWDSWNQGPLLAAISS